MNQNSDGKRILVVDDDPFDRLTFVCGMRSIGLDVQIVELGEPEEAEQTYLSLNPDCVFLDIRMNPIDGFEVLQALRRNQSASSETPIYMLSSSNSRTDREKAQRFGATAYFVKPDSFSGYEEMLRGILMPGA